MYLYKFGAGHRKYRSSRIAWVRCRTWEVHYPCKWPSWKKFHTIGLGYCSTMSNCTRKRQGRRERTVISVYSAVTHSNPHRSLNCPLNLWVVWIPRSMMNQMGTGKHKTKAAKTKCTYPTVSKHRWYASFIWIWYNLDVLSHCNTQQVESLNEPLQRKIVHTRRSWACICTDQDERRAGGKTHTSYRTINNSNHVSTIACWKMPLLSNQLQHRTQLILLSLS